MNACVLYSGGKDSTYSAYIAMKQDKVKCLVTLVPEREDSYMFHFPNIKWTSIQSRAAGIPQVLYYTKGEKEKELGDLREALKIAKERYNLDRVYTGAIRSLYQKKRAEEVCSSLGLECISPLWNIDQEIYMQNLVQEGFRAIITSVSALGLNESWLGRELNEKSVKEIIEMARKNEFNPAFEGGEGETFVLDCPFFNSYVKIVEYDKVWDGYTGKIIIHKAVLVKKKSKEGVA